MPLVKINEKRQCAYLYDGQLMMTFEQINVNFYTGFTKNGITTILEHRGYTRSGAWEKTDWGWQAVFCKRQGR